MSISMPALSYVSFMRVTQAGIGMLNAPLNEFRKWISKFKLINSQILSLLADIRCRVADNNPVTLLCSALISVSGKKSCLNIQHF